MKLRYSVPLAVAASAAIAFGFFGKEMRQLESTIESAFRQVQPLAEPASRLPGEYKCFFTPKSLNSRSAAPFMMPRELKIRREGGDLMLYGTGAANRVRLDAAGDSFSFSMSYPGGSSVDAAGRLDADGGMTITETRHSNGNTYVNEYSCKGGTKQASSPPPVIRKGVFIRPCPGQFYGSFIDLPPKAFDGGTVASACGDMASAGVTDIFILFKTDQEGIGCGDYGDTLFDSQHSPAKQFAAARAKGFDPIISLMKTCQGVFSKAGLKVSFHAWFPVFKDPDAAAIKGMRAVEDKLLFPAEYRSAVFADPSDSSVVEYELSLIAEIAKMSPRPAGINLDYIRYAEKGDAKAGYRWDVRPEAITGFVAAVRERNPGFTLSADIFSNPDGRLGIGQEGVGALVDLVIPMEYSYFGTGMGGSDSVALLTSVNRFDYPGKAVMPVLRGWSIADPRSKGLAEDLRADIKAAAGSAGHAVFTYEQLRKDTGSTLSELSKKTGY